MSKQKSNNESKGVVENQVLVEKLKKETEVTADKLNLLNNLLEQVGC